MGMALFFHPPARSEWLPISQCDSGHAIPWPSSLMCCSIGGIPTLPSDHQWGPRALMEVVEQFAHTILCLCTPSRTHHQGAPSFA